MQINNFSSRFEKIAQAQYWGTTKTLAGAGDTGAAARRHQFKTYQKWGLIPKSVHKTKMAYLPDYILKQLAGAR